MTTYPSQSRPVGTDTLLILAWFSTLDLRALLQRKQHEQPWKNPSHLLEEVLHTCLDDALVCLRGDPIYGPVLLCLVRSCISRVDLQDSTWAISLEEQASPSHAVFFSDDPNLPAPAADQQKNGSANETEAFRQAMTEHIPLVERLCRLSQAWKGDVCRGACELRTFCFLYLDLIQRPLRVPFFLHELLRMSLSRVNWHCIAAQILQVPDSTSCQCMARMQEEPLGAAKAEYLGELFRLVGDEIVQHSQGLPESQRTQVLFLMDMCRETTRAMLILTPMSV